MAYVRAPITGHLSLSLIHSQPMNGNRASRAGTPFRVACALSTSLCAHTQSDSAADILPDYLNEQ